MMTFFRFLLFEALSSLDTRWSLKTKPTLYPLIIAGEKRLFAGEARSSAVLMAARDRLFQRVISWLGSVIPIERKRRPLRALRMRSNPRVLIRETPRLYRRAPRLLNACKHALPVSFRLPHQILWINHPALGIHPQRHSQLRHVYLHAQCSERRDGSPDPLHVRIRAPLMQLQSHAVDRHARGVGSPAPSPRPHSPSHRTFQLPPRCKTEARRDRLRAP